MSGIAVLDIFSRGLLIFDMLNLEVLIRHIFGQRA